ncbi:hypothetical protein MRX96_015750 [Rhipicephalus microplus]
MEFKIVQGVNPSIAVYPRRRSESFPGLPQLEKQRFSHKAPQDSGGCAHKNRNPLDHNSFFYKPFNGCFMLRFSFFNCATLSLYGLKRTCSWLCSRVEPVLGPLLTLSARAVRLPAALLPPLIDAEQFLEAGLPYDDRRPDFVRLRERKNLPER